jgi:DNA-directed RNA polymerase sigma subunit (sigma70/sigma32)
VPGWREQQRDAKKAEKAAALAAAAAKIDRQRGLTRDEKIKAMRDLGMTLQSIGDLLGLTRERVRQIITHQGLQGRRKPRRSGRGGGGPAA